MCLKRSFVCSALGARYYSTSHAFPPRRLTSSSSRRSHLKSLTALSERLPHIEFSSNRYELERHGRGESYHSNFPPDMIAMPRKVEQVQEILRYCYEHCIPVIPFGAGTSVEGHVSALYGGLSLDLCNFQDMDLPDIQGDCPDPIATVGAGVTRKALNQALRHTVRRYCLSTGKQPSSPPNCRQYFFISY